MLFKNIHQSINEEIKNLKSTPEEYLKFKESLNKLLLNNEVDESEEFLKINLKTFLKDSLKSNYSINTKDRIDLVVYNGEEFTSPPAVLIETKKKSNKHEMMSINKINCKSLQELILYYLKERIDNNNIYLKNLIITDSDNWFIFDAVDFEKNVFENKELVKLYTKFSKRELSGTSTTFFYKYIASPFIEKHLSNGEMSCLYFNINEYSQQIKKESFSKKLDYLMKVFTPYFLLKKQPPKPKNTIDKSFYKELLYILGLEEKRKKIQRLEVNKREPASLIENTITQLKISGKFEGMPNKKNYGIKEEEQLFNISLQLIISWVNRILFIKLLEGFLKSIKNYHLPHHILNKNLISDTHDLQELFFQVLAIPENERQDYIQKKYKNIPYLNSSLFELTELEKQLFSISSINNIEINLYKSTVIDTKNKSIKIIPYLIQFFENYTFTYHEKNQSHEYLINPSILGLVFEKLNGYKEGSYYTPTEITSLMTTKTIEKAVLNKFNTIKNWNCQNLIELYNKIDNISEANKIVESIKICDPSVGSGHFLVSALNKLISIKHDLGILTDENGKLLKQFEIKNINDELIVLDEGIEFVYNPKNYENHRLQKAMFHEKRKIIEKSLFGVDINPNSVNICRLRLWIELLKSSYISGFTSEQPHFVTLPNIDINIKQGDSLLSFYDVSSNLSIITKNSKYKVKDYKEAIEHYIKTNSKNEKYRLLTLIQEIKDSFKNMIKFENSKIKKKRELESRLFGLDHQLQFFETSSKREINKQKKHLKREIENLNIELQQIEDRKNIDNLFEWRFEFPEILNENAQFVGFDILIGNPPYFNLSRAQKELYEYGDIYKNVTSGITNITSLFIYLSLFKLLKDDGLFSFIVPKSITYVDSWQKIRRDILSNSTMIETHDVGKAFEGVGLEQIILILQNRLPNNQKVSTYHNNIQSNSLEQNFFKEKNLILHSIQPEILNIIKIIENDTVNLKCIAKCPRGTTVNSKYLTSNVDDSKTLLLGGNNIAQYYLKNGTKRKPNQYVSKTLIKEKQKNKLGDASRKIVYQNIMSSKPKIVAALDKNYYFTGDTVNNLILNDDNYCYEYILAILNSPISTFYLKYMIVNNSKLTVHLDSPYVGKLPIKPIDIKSQYKIKEMVEKINSNYSSALHREINDFIYDIYEISYSNKMVIEESLK